MEKNNPLLFKNAMIRADVREKGALKCHKNQQEKTLLSKELLVRGGMSKKTPFEGWKTGNRR